MILGVSWPQLLTSIVSFAILIFLLYRFLYTPLSTMMRERTQKIRDSLDEAQKARAEVADASEQIEKDMQAARVEAANVVAEARAAAKKFTEQEHERTRKQVQATLAEAQTEIERQKVAAIEDVRREFGDLAVSAAEKIIRTKIDRKADQKLIGAVLDDVIADKDRNN